MEQGLSSKEAQQKLKVIGRNEIVAKEPPSALSVFLSQLPTVINAVLIVAAIFSFLIKNIVDGLFIFTVLLLNALFGFFQEYKAEKSLEKLKKLVTSLCRVIRDGKEIQIETVELVPGDIVILSEGDRVPADGKTITSFHMEIDESIITGESLPVIKKEGDEVFGGTLVTKGKAYLKIEKTGMQTKFGQIAQTLSQIEEDTTPLQKNLDGLGKILSLIAVIISLSLIPIGISQNKPLFPLILLAISIGIAAIPEGLPAVITIALGIGTNRMAKKHAIVRKLPAVETLGAVQIILTDKTGTLTQNKMQVKEFWLKNKKLLPELIQACVLGNTASLLEKEKNKFDILGDKTDGALLIWAKNQTKDINKVKDDVKVLDEYVFDPISKIITTVFSKGKNQSVVVRGAPETIIKNSKVTQKEKEEIESIVKEYASSGLRVIGFGVKEEKHALNLTRDHLEQNLNFLGVIGIYDPPRIEAKEAISNAKKAGIKIVMVTGDNELTAVKIAQEVGLIEKDEDVITGNQLDKLSDSQLKEVILKTRIFARVKPEDKLRLVTAFQEKGYVVGVTGDGVNDALALKKADVGIAMGETGTDVAKEASDIILTDDNFATITHAIEEGRVIYNNIAKSITYLLSGNLAEISLVFFASLLGLPTPLLPTQILWMNLVTDGLPALALASDNKDPNLLTQKPRNKETPLLNKNRILFIFAFGLGLAAILLITYSILLKISSEIFARTVTFNLLIFLHLMIAFIVRGGSFFRVNKLLIGGVIVPLVLQAVISVVPPFQKIFHLGF